ncbi:hypothetical protein [Arthrobacter caoxuetaonis]|uniref:hypothetical protein n=1 Tax=Arthrobacter caoxuetaonis TaxID=2886935 RepID=UPI001D141B01|nr:hypothetical protein [Arthrobacter caoxuetaonis]MCC3283879.1 hypothetical protein [Arthrobacter caoxuetaonis]
MIPQESRTDKPRGWRPFAVAVAAAALVGSGLAGITATAASAMDLAEPESLATAEPTPLLLQEHDHGSPSSPAEPTPEPTPTPSDTAESSPEASSPAATPAATPSAAAGTGHDHVSAPDSPYSTAYLERNWKPTKYDTCTAELHASFTALGPDGKIYPTWHPAQVTDPATGELCTFGHEHGADPRTSNIYGWVVDYLTPEDADGKTGIPFGYASEALMTYGAAHEGMAMRHEDNAGHKIFVANNVQLLDVNRDWVLDTAGAVVTCDFLIKQHQGSWSPDATSNNAHEAIYASRCSDGTEIISTTLSKFGNSNEFHKNCGVNERVGTLGSKLPAGYGGSRLIPDASCVQQHATGTEASLWGMYELWKGENKITDTAGNVLAHFDPWFGIRNPSRYYDAAKSTGTSNGISRPVDLAWGNKPAAAFPWTTVKDAAGLDWQDPASPFDGAQRDFYLNQNSVSSLSTGTLFTDPYGTNGQLTEFTGSIRQHLVNGTATAATLATQKFDTAADFGKNNGVHAPN